MARITDLISDIELRLSKGNVSDDFQIDRRQIRHWLDVVRNEVINEYVRYNGAESLDNFVTLYDCLDIVEEDKNCDDGCDSTKFAVSLPGGVACIDNGLGVYRVETQGGETIKRMKLTDVSRFKHLKFGNPNKKNICWYLLKDKIFIEGGTDNFKKNGKINVYLLLESTSSLSEDSEFPVDPAIVAGILDRVEAIGRRELELPEDEINDGKQA